MTVKAEKEHKWLQQLVGEWTYETEFSMSPDQPPKKLRGTETIRPIGELWIIAEGRGEMPDGGEAVTMLTVGYDPQKKQFVGTWLGSMMTYLWHYAGSLNGSATALTLESTGPSGPDTDPADPPKMSRFRDVIELSGDKRIFTSSMEGEDGTWNPIMTVHYQRRA